MAAKNSLLAKAREARQSVKDRAPKNFEIPGTDNVIYAKYKPLDYREIRSVKVEFQDPENPSPDEEISLLVGVLSRALLDVLVHDEETDKYTPLAKEPSGWRDLADALGIEVDPDLPVSYVIKAIFPTEMHLVTHGSTVMSWAAGVEAEADKAVLDS